MNTLPRPAQTRVLVVANQKGGVGKTTSTVNLGAALATFGQRVLIIDLDPQGNASTALGIDHHGDVVSIYDVLVEGKPLDDATQETHTENLYCVPATIDLAGAELEMASVVAREQRLTKAIKGSSRHYDYILLDCPPSLGLLTTNALTAGTEVLIPIQCEYYALEGVSSLMKVVELVQDNLNPEITVTTVLLTMFAAATRLAHQVEEEVRAHFADQTLKTKIPRSVRAAEAPSHGQTLLQYDRSSPAALAYVEAAREMSARSA